MGVLDAPVQKVALKPDLISFPSTRDQLLLHDHAGTGFPSWEPLINGGQAAAGSLSFNGRGLELISPDVSTSSPNGQIAGCSALHRLTRPNAQSRVYMKFEWRARVFRTSAGVFSFSKGFEFGIDTADWGTASLGGTGSGGLEPVAANRTLAMVRCCIQDESNTTYYGGKWQINAGSAAAPSWIDLKDGSNNLISPTVAGYEALQVGMNYGKWLRQRTELVFLLTPVTVTAASPVTLSTTASSTAVSYTGAVDPVAGAPVTGTSVSLGTYIASVNTAAKTAVLSVNATATTNTQAGAAFTASTLVARLEGLRHNDIGFGSLAGTSGYNNSVSTNSHANDLLNQQGVVSGTAIPAISQDQGFQGGMNIYTQIDNRSNQLSKAKLLIERAKVVAF